jgi:hypothetical protein
VAGVGYRYELRRDDEIVATGHLTLDAPVSAGDPIAIGSSRGTVRDVQPIYGQRERRLVIDLGTPELPGVRRLTAEEGLEPADPATT